jgi:hypothetical protein
MVILCDHYISVYHIFCFEWLKFLAPKDYTDFQSFDFERTQ